MDRCRLLGVPVLSLFKQELCLLFRKRWIRRCFCALAIFVVAGSVLVWWLLWHAWSITHSCTDANSKEYLSDLCSNYSRGLITGSLCRSLCETKEIEFEKCLGHGVKLHVLRATWKGNTVILKTPKNLGSSIAVRHAIDSLLPGSPLGKEGFTMTKKTFIERAKGSIYYKIAGQVDTKRTTEVIEEIFSECDMGNDGILGYDESILCWELIETDEYMLYKILGEKSAMLNVYGVCGNMYAVEYAATEPFLGFLTSWSDGREWRLRARLALALLEMIAEFEDTPFGTFYLCDVQEPNFGVVKRADGRLVAKAIDVDLSQFRSALLLAMDHDREAGVGCSSDRDCTFFRCLGECDVTTGVCSGKLKSSNLVLLCRLVFTQKYQFHPNLLCDPPAGIAEPLKKVLRECSKAGPSHMDWDLYNELTDVLTNSI